MNQPQVPSHTPRWLPSTMWAIFTIILLVTLTLSFQTGTATKALEKPLVSQVTNTMTTLPSEEAILTITYYIRQIGRALLFFLLGLTGSWSIHLTFRKTAARNRFLGTVLMLFIISYFTEKMKIFIPGRHYSFPECLESFLFGILGCICITFLLYHLRRIASRPPESNINKTASGSTK